MVNKVREYIKKNDLLAQGDGVVVGCSGGADSMCLLHILLQLKEEYQLRLTVVHVNHQLRGREALRDQHFVEDFCREKNLPCVVKSFPVEELAKKDHLSCEEAGRKVRYESFFQVLKAENHEKIAVAHHENDLCETMLWNLMRGTGLRGLGGISPKQGDIIRPLLGLSAKEIRQWMKTQDYPWVEDSTNAGNDYTRNQIRNQIIPKMEELASGCLSRMRSTAEEMQESNQYFQELAQDFVKQYGTWTKNGLEISKKEFLALHQVVKPYVVGEALTLWGAGRKDIGRIHMEQICQLAEKEVGALVQLPGGREVESGYCTLIFLKKQENEPPKSNCSMELNLFSLKKQQKIIEKMYTKWFDYDKIKVDIQLRHRQVGDRIAVMPGKTKKLKDYFIDEKIPQKERDGIFLVTAGQDVLWVVGHRMSEDYKITENTKMVLEIKIKGV